MYLPFKGKQAACQSHRLHHHYHHCCQSQTKSSLHLNCPALQKISWIRKLKLVQSNQIIIMHKKYRHTKQKKNTKKEGTQKLCLFH